MKEVLKKTQKDDALGLFVDGVKLGLMLLWSTLKVFVIIYRELEKSKSKRGFYTYLVILLFFWNYNFIITTYIVIIQASAIEEIIASIVIAIISIVIFIILLIKLLRL